MALVVMAVVMSASSWNQMLGSSLRHGSADTPPSTIGISTESPVRLSVMVMESAMESTLPLAALAPGSDVSGHFAPGAERRTVLLPGRAGGVEHDPGGQSPVAVDKAVGNLGERPGDAEMLEQIVIDDGRHAVHVARLHALPDVFGRPLPAEL